MINKIDISSLFREKSDLRDKVDKMLFSSACNLGFLKIYGIPNKILKKSYLKDLLAILLKLIVLQFHQEIKKDIIHL